jgi:hypothetical protein
MFGEKKISIEWGAFKYAGSVEHFEYVMDELFARMPPDADYTKRVLDEQARVNGEGYT